MKWTSTLRALVAVTLTAGTLAIVESGSAPVAEAADLTEDFEGVPVGSDPVGWIDTAANNSMAGDDSLFSVMDVGGSQVLGTASTAKNIHSHHEGGPWATSTGYTYTGRMMVGAQRGGVGVTFFSDYDQSDSYYRLRRFGTNGSFHINPHATSMTGGVTDTGVVPTAGVWYRFAVEVVDTGSRTEVRAKVWEDGTTEPSSWQVDAFDSSASRLTSGTIGVWSHSSGSKYWDDLTVATTTAPGPHTVTLSAVGQGAVSANPDLPDYPHGSSVDVTATPDPGWVFTGWSGDLTGTTNPATVTVEQNLSIQAQFAETATLTTQVVGSGSVAVSPDQPSYLVGDSVTLTATPDPGWVFTGWSGDLTGTTNPATVTLSTASTDVTANFAQIPPATLTTQVVGSGSVAVSPDQPSYLEGDSVTLTATPDPGWVFTGWSGDLTGAENPASLTLSGDMSVTATFTEQSGDLYEDFEGVPVGSDPVGWIDTAADNSMVGDDSLFSVMDVDGSQVFGTTSTASNIHSHHEGGPWSAAPEYAYTGRMMVDSQGGGIGVTFFSDYDQTDSYYRLRRFGSDGSFHINPHGTSMSGGVTDTGVVPTAGVWYRFAVEVVDTGSRTEVRAKVWEDGTSEPSSWQIDAFDSSASRLTSGTIGVWSFSNGAKHWDDLSVSAISVPGPHTLSLSSAGQGSIAADPDQAQYDHNTSVQLTATPDPGWEFTGWSGDLTGTTNPETIVLDQNRSVTATFTEVIPATLTTQVVGNGTLDASPPSPYTLGDDVTLTATPDPGWRFTGWSGDLAGTANPTTVTLSAASTSITANFEELPAGAVTLTLDTVGPGAIAASPNQSSYVPGEAVTVTATPDPGYRVGRFDTSPPLVDDWWDTQWDYRTSVDVDSAGAARVDALASFDVNFTSTFSELGTSATFDVNSLRVVEVDAGGGVIDAAVPFQFDPAAGFDAAASASGTMHLLLGGSTPAGTVRSFDIYFDAVGKGFSPAVVSPRVTTTDGVADEGLTTVRVANDTATYFYDKAGGGFSSLVDGDGNDWISWSSANGSAGEYRGIPNLVYPAGLMGPGNGGSSTVIVDQGPLATTLRSTSSDGQWVTEWTIGPRHAELTVVSAPGQYWFLYEGTPGGTLDPATDVVGRSDGTVTAASETWNADLAGDEWVFFGDPGVGRSLYVVNRQQDTEVDSYRPLDGVMTVFGFGRTGVNPLLTGAPASFVVGLAGGTDFASVAPRAGDAHQPLAVTSTGSRNLAGSVTGVDSFTFPILADQTVTAVFEQVPTSTLNVTVTGNGSVTVTPDQPTYLDGDQVVLTAVPGAGTVFDRWSGDATGSTNPITVTVSGSTVVNATFVSESSQPVIDVWWGDTQSYGDAGFPQPYYNLLGNVTDPDGIDSLSYTVNGGPQRGLNVGPDNRRLARAGDFNADIPIDDLQVGPNTVVVFAVDGLGNSASRTVTLTREAAATWPSDYTIDWSTVTDPTDVGQVVDGKWVLEQDGLRMVEPDYDRLFDIGDLNWTDYEITVPVTINALDTSGFDSGSSGNGLALGLLMRWNGHTDDPVANWQPKSGWLPLGAIGWYWWNSQTSGQLKLTGTDGTIGSQGYGTPPAVGSTLWYKMRVETNPDNSSTYSLKYWEQGQPEPTDWTIDGTANAGNPLSGSVALIAHHVDATFGDVVVTPLSSPAGTLDVQVVGNGSVDVDPQQTSYAYGESATLTALPDPGWEFAGWSGDLTGLQNPQTLVFDGSKQVTATFTSATAPPVISNVQVERFVDSAIVTFDTDKPTTASVVYGTTSAYGSGPETSSTLATSHSVTLPGLEADTTYHYEITVTDNNSNTAATPDDTFTTLPAGGGGIVSDDFNVCSVDTSLWTFVDPIGDATFVANGQQLEIQVPGGTEHNVWSGGNNGPRVMQPLADTDFAIEAKFESMVTQQYQMQGLIVQEDVDDFLRFDFFSDGVDVKMFAARFVAGAPTTLANVTVPISDAPMYMRVTRSGDTWLSEWSTDGSTWTAGASFTHALAVSEAGVFAGNAGSVAPAHVALVDYAFNTSSPIVPEDPDTPTCSTGVPAISNVSVTPGPDSAVVSWDTDEPTTGSVVWGTSATYGSGPVSSSTLQTSHSVTLTGLAESTPYHFQITATDVDSNSVVTPDDTFTTTSSGSGGPALLASDDFNVCAVDTSLWTFVDPIGDGSYSANGTQLAIDVPGGTEHNVWTGGNNAPRLMQPVADGDFAVEAKFESMVSLKYQMQGLIVQEDLDDILRFDFFSDGGSVRLFAARMVAGTPNVIVNTDVSVTDAPMYMRVTRTGDTWTYQWSLDGSAWATAASFTDVINVSEVGVFAGNSGSVVPAHTALVDYVFDTAAPIVPEDAVSQTCP